MIDRNIPEGWRAVSELMADAWSGLITPGVGDRRVLARSSCPWRGLQRGAGRRARVARKRGRVASPRFFGRVALSWHDLNDAPIARRVPSWIGSRAA